ncbi:HAD-IIA family hydrolase [Herbiconiux sp. KACC 21604]|uniref:HAD-IIA family hydrolase n=1 Tax=unclassified Herbiconiux TaxID=2618217 RepID=UPI001492E970|nr:HAD-IIA family hydrolase [Herbiconiux sp. SALV-R1]QJU53067.1 HAD-IIA family hydrolase [Herbiconiux sp. SALV-R1]WPO88002.1 HAD-IIA family hydrolase [Herbiconiux sp. KACC 21604]
MGLFTKKTDGQNPTPLEGVDAVLADLDGVVYQGPDPIPHAVDSLLRVSSEGLRVGYITNNASRTDSQVAEHLSSFGLQVAPHDVVTSPQAAMRLMATLIDPGATVLVVGGVGLVSEVEKAGFVVTRSVDDRPAAVVQGFAPEVGWTQLAEASFALHDPAVHWVATNTDWTIPVARGIAPGNGTLVSAVHTAVGRLPVVAGKPETPIFEVAKDRFGASNAAFIGDRLDTDTMGAKRAGLRAIHVLTGIDRAKQLLAAPKGQRPDFIVDDLRQLFDPYPATIVSKDGSETRVGASVVRMQGHVVRVVKAGDSATDLVRAGAAAIWNSGLSIHALDVAPEIYA